MGLPSITYEFKVDWDATDWSATPDFSEDIDDLSDSVRYVAVRRGEEREPGNSPAATLEVGLKPGLDGTYSPFTTGTLAGKIRPWVPVRLRTFYNSTYYTQFTGFISRISINPHKNVRSVSFYCTDGMDLLARQLVAQDPNNAAEMSDGDAVETVLNAAGWSATKRDINKDGGSNFFKYPDTGVY